MINLRNSINSKEIPQNENPKKKKKIVSQIEKILDFIKQQKGKGIKILTPKKMFRRLPLAHALIKAGNTSANLLNEIRQIIYSWYWEKEITKNVYNNMNSIRTQNIKDSKQNDYYIYEFWD